MFACVVAVAIRVCDCASVLMLVVVFVVVIRLCVLCSWLCVVC